MACLLMGFMIYGEIGRAAGIAMVTLLLLYVFLQYRMAMKGEIEVEEDSLQEFKNAFQPYILLAIGLAGVAIGAEFLVRGAKESASIIGVPEAVIALSIIALGTSLPELSTCISAVRKGHSDIVLGNIIGSNVFNILMILGVTAAIKPIAEGSFAPQLVSLDIWVTVLVSVIFTLLIVFFKKIGRVVGMVFCGAYIVYNIYIYAIYIS